MTQAPFTFGSWVRQRRRAASLTQEALAALVPCSADLIRKIESGARHPAPRRALRLAECLGVPGEHREAWLALARGAQVPAPALEALRPPSTLPRPPTSLVGRKAEISLVRQRLEEAAVVTLLGPPGSGKSRLALAVAAELRDSFPDGVFWVDLAPVRDPNDVPLTLAQALRLDDVTARNAQGRLHLALRERQALLVLDNFEQVLPAAAGVADLASTCPWMKFLVTSRWALRVRGERRVNVGPLELPKDGGSAERIAASPAVRLFVERARDAQPDFALDERNAGTVAAICGRLDGLPLALELAAAQLRVLDPAGLLEQFGHHLLSALDAPVDARHHSLHAAFEASARNLEPDVRAFFRRLSVFPGGFPLSGAEEVAASSPGRGLALAGALLDAGLLHRAEPDRLRLLQPLREYAGEELAAAGEVEATRERHAEWVLGQVERWSALLHGPEQVAAHRALEREAGHIREALRWWQGRDAVRGARLATALFWWWSVQGQLAEGRDWLDVFLASPDLPDSVRAGALWRRGVLALLQREGEKPEDVGPGPILDLATQVDEALALQDRLGDHRERACALTLRAGLTHILGDPAGGERLFREALTLPGPHWVQRVALGYLAGLGRNPEFSIRELASAREDGDLWAAADALHSLALFEGMEGQYEAARTHLAEALALFRALHDRRRTAWALITAANLERRAGQPDVGRAELIEALGLAREMGHPGYEAMAERALAGQYVSPVFGFDH